MGKGSKTVSNHLFEGINKATEADVRKATEADVRKAYIVLSERMIDS